MTVSVLLALAGDGTRFGAIYPKELHAVSPNRTVLQRCIEPLMSLDLTSVRVVAVVRMGRARSMEVVMNDLGGRGAEVVFAFQSPRRHGLGLPGAVRAGLPFCDGVTAVFLADQIFTTQEPEDLGMAIALAEQEGRAVLVYRTTDEAALRAEGAVALDRDRRVVSACEEKPRDAHGKFDGVWVVPIVAPEYRRLLPEIARDPGRVLTGAAYVEVSSYRNVTRPEDVWGL